MEAGVYVAVEFGPKDVLTYLMKKYAPEIRSLSLQQYGLLDHFQQEYMIQREQLLSVIGRCLRIAVSTKNYNNDYDIYQKKVVLPYKEVEILFEELHNSGKIPDEEQLDKAIRMVKSVLEHKKVPQAVKVKKMEQIFERKALKW